MGHLQACRCLAYANLETGPEKLLEVWFAPDAEALPATCAPNGLKAVPADTWKEMLDLVNCKVLSVLESDTVDGYLLSESSMFVWPHKLILKTCGTTTLLCGLPRMLEIAALSAGFPHVPANLPRSIPAAATPYRIFYSRKNFLFPNQQRGPHRSWRDEVRFLDKMFLGGSAYMIGKMNGDHWYLYTTGPDTKLTPPASPDREPTKTKFLDFPDAKKAVRCGEDDETLEILMTDLDEQNARQFYLEDASAVAEGHHFQKVKKNSVKALGTIREEKANGHVSNDDGFDVFEQTSSDNSQYSSDDDDLTLPEELTTEGHALGTIVSEGCGLSDVYAVGKYPEAKIDAYMFNPCGFSANGVIPPPPTNGNGKKNRAGHHYFTVHVTPEPQCSYASFETNVPAHQSGRETADVVEQVVNIFKPGRFSVTIFENKKDAESGDGIASANKTGRMDNIAGYKRMDRIVHDLEGYDLVFRYYERFDWKGGAPRLGEVI